MGRVPLAFLTWESYQKLIKLEHDSVLEATRNLQALRRFVIETG